MKLTGIEIDGKLYHIATSYVYCPCDECSLSSLCGHDGSFDTLIERLCSENISENDCFV
jgi:hypothetical protein